MSKINEMIRDLCPEGVKRVKLGEVCEVKRGVRVVKNELDSSKGYPVYQNSLSALGYYPEYNTPANTTFVISAGAAGKIGFSNSEFWAADDCLRLFCPDYLSGKYAYYCMLNNEKYFTSQVRKASVPRLSREVVERFEFPLPPLPVQEKIVEILDKFSLLSAELEAELEGRRKQYDFYRNRLLSFDSGSDSVQWKTLGDVGKLYGGLSGKSKKDFDNGNAKFITYKNVYSNLALAIDVPDTVMIYPGEKQNTVQYGDILFTGSSETPDECAMSSVLTTHTDEPLYLNSFCFGFRFNSLDGICPDFYKHYFRCAHMRKLIAKTAHGTTRFNVSKKEFAQLSIPMLPIAEQERIVCILDKFEALVTDLSAGLPAEIDHVQKRYEYYRDLLLTFPEKQ